MIVFKSVIVILPALTFYSQYTLTSDSKSLGSFTPDVCVLSIIANILRINFWFIDRFSLSFVIQSIFTIVIQLFLFNACLKTQNKEKTLIFGVFRCKQLSRLIAFTGILCVCTGIFTRLLIQMQIQKIKTIVGLVSLLIEASQGLPLLISMFRKSSMAGVSPFMIFFCFITDYLKILYSIVELQPHSFIFSGAIQLAVDTFILMQAINVAEVKDAEGDQNVEKINLIREQSIEEKIERQLG